MSSTNLPSSDYKLRILLFRVGTNHSCEVSSVLFISLKAPMLAYKLLLLFLRSPWAQPFSLEKLHMLLFLVINSSRKFLRQTILYCLLFLWQTIERSLVGACGEIKENYPHVFSSLLTICKKLMGGMW